MKKIALVVLLLFSALTWAGTSDPADYTINVHVNSVRLLEHGDLRLKVTIDGKKYELWGSPIGALLVPGDYKARLVKDKHPRAYDSYKVYEFLFPDNKTRNYRLVGIEQ